MEQTALATIAPGGYPALAGPPGLPEAIRENIGTEDVTPFDLPQVRVPSGGGIAWEIPSLDGEPDTAKEITGVIAYSKITRSYWTLGFDESGGGSPPDCASADGIVGIGNPGGECRSCEFAQFGSSLNKDGDPGRGQACKQQRVMFLLQAESFLPVAVVAPPTSLRNVKRYLMGLGGQGLPYWHVVTTLKLEKAQSHSGITYARIVPSFVGVLSDEERAAASAYKEGLTKSLAGYHEEKPAA